MKKKICKAPGCEVEFTPSFSTTQKVCSPHCAIELDKLKKREKQRAVDKKRVKELNESSLSWQHKQTQLVFNRFIRMRDHDQPCISCGATAGTYRITAGHYRSVGAAPHLRYNEDNVHGQCWYNCNKNKSGNIVEYRINLVGKIGVERVENLETDNTEKKYTVAEVADLRELYKQKIKLLKQTMELAEKELVCSR